MAEAVVSAFGSVAVRRHNLKTQFVSAEKSNTHGEISDMKKLAIPFTLLATMLGAIAAQAACPCDTTFVSKKMAPLPTAALAPRALR
jgi:hypothetical protein